METRKRHERFEASDYQIRQICRQDFSEIRNICGRVNPHNVPYSESEMEERITVCPQGQFVAEHLPTSCVAGVHFTLRLMLTDFHIDDSWNVLTDHGTFDNHNLLGHTLYGADLFVSPDHQHHGLARALTDAARDLVIDEKLWRMVGGSRIPGYSAVAAMLSPEEYVAEVVAGQRIDPVLTVHLKDGWTVVKAIRGYMQDDPESADCVAVIQWVNPVSPPPAKFMLR